MWHIIGLFLLALGIVVGAAALFAWAVNLMGG